MKVAADVFFKPFSIAVVALLIATAASYVVSPRAMGPVAVDPEREADRLSASFLIAFGARIVREMGDIVRRAKEAGKGIEIKYAVPKEGTILWFDMLAIPKDAPNPDSAYAFMNYMMTPQIIADVSNFKRYANANSASQSMVLPAVKDDPGIYPTKEQRQKLALQSADSPEQTRAITRVWQKFKTGE